MTTRKQRWLLASLVVSGCLGAHPVVSLKCDASVTLHPSYQNVVLDDSPPPNLIDIQFLSPKVGWLAGRIGLFKTNDGGKTWSRVGPAIAVGENLSPFVLGIVTPIFQLDFINDKLGWIQRADGILRTTDGGLTWELIAGLEQSQSQALNNFNFYDETNGWALKDGSIYHTGDGGRNWVRQTGFAEARVVKASSASECWVVGDKGRILRTSDGGRSWIPSAIGTDENLLSIAVIDAKFVWVISSNAIYHSDDLGRTWKLSFRDHSNQSMFRSIGFATKTTGWVVGNKGTILHTNDGGNTWRRQKGTVTVDLSRISVVDQDVAWIIGADLMLRSVDGGNIWSRRAIPKSYR